MTVSVGLDIGGTKIMVAAADHEGNILRRARADTSLTSLETDLANINRMIAEVAAEEEIVGLGAGNPWATGLGTGHRLSAAPACLAGCALKAMMRSKWGCTLPR